MVHQTETGRPAPAPSRNGPALAILATAPRPGLVLQGICPPLRAAEAGALQTAWLKHIAQELPGVAVFLFGRPVDALPMLRYFAGPGVELREWRSVAAETDTAAAMAGAATELFELGYGPVLVRVPDAPEPTQDDLLACAAAATRGDIVWAPDQRGAPWLLGLPAPHDVHRLRELMPAPGAVRRGPWARRVRNATDLELLLHERDRLGRGGDRLPTLPVRNLSTALREYETMFAAEVIAREAGQATVQAPEFALRLRERTQDFAANGLWLPCEDPARRAATLPPQRIAPDGQLAELVGGGMDVTALDADGNRLTFGSPMISP